MEQFTSNIESLQDENWFVANYTIVGVSFSASFGGSVPISLVFCRTGSCGCRDVDILDWRIVTGEYLEILREIGQDGESVQELALHHILGVQQGRDAKLLLGHVEGQAVVAEHVVRVQAVEVNEVGVVVVDDGAETEAIPPACGHVDDVDILVLRRDPLGPGLQRFGSGQSHRSITISLSCQSDVGLKWIYDY